MFIQSQLTIIRWALLIGCLFVFVTATAAQQRSEESSTHEASDGLPSPSSTDPPQRSDESLADNSAAGLADDDSDSGVDRQSGDRTSADEGAGLGDGGGYPGGGHGYGAVGEGGYGAGDYGGGGYGGRQRLPLQFAIVEGVSEDGMPQGSEHTATRVRQFGYQLGSLKPLAVSPILIEGEYGGSKYSVPTGMGGPVMMGPGGPGQGRMAGSGMVPASIRGSQDPTISIIAYLFDDDRENGRCRIELVTPPPPKSRQKNSTGGGYGGEEMYGGRKLGDMGFGRKLKRYVRFESLADPEASEQGYSFELSPQEAEIVSDTIRLTVWRNDLIQAIYQQPRDDDALATLESQLKSVLTEQFETQIARQRLEIERVEQKVEQLKDDLKRRAAVQDRSVEVQLGRIVLEAQGLLGK